ncbi:hypothetical protein [Nitratifractor sp.]
MKRYGILLYALFSYLVGLGTLLYLLFWVYPWSRMPTTLDGSHPHSDPLFAFAVDVTLILLFGLRHSWGSNIVSSGGSPTQPVGRPTH